MLVYWSMFAVPALSSLLAGGRVREQARNFALLGFILIIFTFLIGLRFEVGGDWFSYEYNVLTTRYERLSYTLSYGDPAFGLLSWVSVRIGLGAQGPTFVCGALFIWGLWRFLREQNEPWLALTAGVPYLVIVVGMGYVRQAAAIGLILLALVSLGRGSLKGVLLWTVTASLFHATALFMLPLLVVAHARRNLAATIPLAIFGAGLFGAILAPRLDAFVEGYVEAEMGSSGALIRLAMNAVPALLFVLFRKRFDLDSRLRLFWFLVSAISLLLLALVFVFPSSTVLDRLGLYLIPIQLFVFGNLVPVVARKPEGRWLVRYAIVAYYAAVLYTWLNYAVHSEYWLPYRTILLQ